MGNGSGMDLVVRGDRFNHTADNCALRLTASSGAAGPGASGQYHHSDARDGRRDQHAGVLRCGTCVVEVQSTSLVDHVRGALLNCVGSILGVSGFLGDYVRCSRGRIGHSVFHLGGLVGRCVDTLRDFGAGLVDCPFGAKVIVAGGLSCSLFGASGKLVGLIGEISHDGGILPTHWARFGSERILQYRVLKYESGGGSETERRVLMASVTQSRGLAPSVRWMRTRRPIWRIRSTLRSATPWTRCQPKLRAAMNNVEIVVEHEPPNGQRLLGLYRGVPLPQRTSNYSGMLPDKITIFSGPITRLAGGDADRLQREIRHVVLHEIAHHFGISDERLIELDRY